jgi:signal transduction histidine kinase
MDEVFQLKNSGLPTEFRAKKADGEWIHMEAFATNLLHNPVIGGIVITARNITERKRLEQQFLQTQKIETVGRLAGGVAHDFNNILTVINGNAEMSLVNLTPADPFYEAFTEIKKSAERASNLTRQLLAFSRKQIVEPKIVNLNQILLDMDKMFRRLIGEHIELVTIPDMKLQMVRVDPGQVEQVLINLVVNARDAMPAGGKLTIETKNIELEEEYVHSHLLIAPGRYVMFAVSDTGVGMDADTLSHIFEPFYTTKPKDSGTGLGLSTCYGIVKQNNGDIQVSSEPGKGTTITVYLPAEETEQISPELHQKEEILRGTETVLLVEDDPGIRKLILRILGKAGYEVREASNGNEALALVQENRDSFHLLITDIVMPLMGGRELANRVSQLFPEIKILFMSGYTDDIIVQHDILDGGIMFIHKPFTPGDFLRKVRDTLDA